MCFAEKLPGCVPDVHIEVSRAAWSKHWPQCVWLTCPTPTHGRAGSNYTKLLQLQLLWNINFNYNYTSIMLYSITITDKFFSRKLHLYLWNFLFIDLGCFPDIRYHIMCGTRNHRKQGYSIILVQNAHVNLLFFFTWILYKWYIKKHSNKQSFTGRGRS